MIENLTPDFIFSDERGTLIQLISNGYKQVNVIFTKAGAKRGRFHYHVMNYEAFFVVNGKLKLLTENDCMIFKENDMFRIPPNIGHSFEFILDTLIISMYSEGVDLADGTRDIIERDVNENE